MPNKTRPDDKTLVLIVDDEPFMRQTFQDLLEAEGFLTALAEDGDSAITGFEKFQPDLVLLDLLMPGKDGFATCRELRGMRGGRYTPIMVVTGRGDTDSVHQAFEAGATDFITKPFNPDLLVYRIRYMLRSGQNTIKLAQSEARLVLLKEAVDSLPLGITINDVNDRIVYINPAEAEMHGYSVAELVNGNGRRFVELNKGNIDIAGQDDDKGVWRCEGMNIRKSGDEFPVQLSTIALRNAEGMCLGRVTVCEDITSRKKAEARIQLLAYYDSLTGLPNRAAFMERLQHALSLARREDRRIGLLFLDLDNFKDINDTQGHDFGDRLIREVAMRLSESMRESDTLARLGGDEFVIALTNISHQESAAFAAGRLLSILSRPFVIDSRQIHTSASIGIALYPDDAQDADGLFKSADTAMYHAKSEGKSNYRFFSSEMNDRINRRVSLENSLRLGMEKQEFFLHYQPQWDLNETRMLGVEALLRWESKDLGFLLPSEFIPLAENSGQIIGLGEWALRAACIQAREWAQAGFGEMKMAVNISGMQFRQPDFLHVIRKIINETGIEPDTLELEFTESVVMEKADKTIDTLRALKNMGMGLSIDDFGTGYSSLSYLKHFPIDRIKIDRSFVADVNRNSDDAAIVEAIISMAHSMNLKVVAEGVETSDQLHFLKERNCDEVQGYHLAVPMSAKDIVNNISWPGEKGSGWHPRLSC
ncbi:MAG TPA: EAL domain-containing protein [Geobacteraceae bacterium]|nr:EAL domain-containing protein [Geobacteraceae bacterium]